MCGQVMLKFLLNLSIPTVRHGLQPALAGGEGIRRLLMQVGNRPVVAGKHYA